MRNQLLVGLLTLASCYDPDVSNGGFICGDNGACPDGLQCYSGRCYRDPPDGSTSDLAIPPADLAMSPADLSTLPPDMPVAAGCSSSMGHQVAPKVYACNGMFNNDIGGPAAASQLCNQMNGWHVCTMGDAPALMNVPANCDASGFFVANLAATVSFAGGSSNIQTYMCQNVSGGVRSIPGCGKASLSLPGNCSGLSKIVTCSDGRSAVAGFMCTLGFQDAQNGNSSNGVLCCHG